MFRHHQNTKKIKGSQSQHPSLDSGPKPWAGNPAQPDSYSRLECPETLFSNLRSNRQKTSQLLLLSLWLLQKVFCSPGETVGGYCSLSFVSIKFIVRFGSLNSCSLALCFSSGGIIVCLIYSQYASAIWHFHCKISDTVTQSRNKWLSVCKIVIFNGSGFLVFARSE